MNKTKTVFIKEILETATSAVFGLLCNYIRARKRLRQGEYPTTQLRQHNGTTQKTAGTVLPAE